MGSWESASKGGAPSNTTKNRSHQVPVEINLRVKNVKNNRTGSITAIANDGTFTVLFDDHASKDGRSIDMFTTEDGSALCANVWNNGANGKSDTWSAGNNAFEKTNGKSENSWSNGK